MADNIVHASMLFCPLYYYNKPNKSKNHTGIPFITGFAENQRILIIRNSVRRTEGSDNGDSDNRGPTVLPILPAVQ